MKLLQSLFDNYADNQCEKTFLLICKPVIADSFEF